MTDAPTGLLIDGAWRPARSGKTFPVEDPANGTVLANVADGAAEDGLAALDAAARAADGWARTPPRERGELLRRAFELVITRTEDFALLMTLEMGKPLGESRSEVTYGAEFLRWFSEEAVRTHGRYARSPEGTTRLLTTKKPVGPCLLVTPWNFPLAMATRKVAPALAAGCTMVLKPANLTPLTSALFASVLMEAGLPKGVLNIVQTTDPGGVVAPILADPRLRKLSFTGSTAVGKQLLKLAADSVLRTSMELGGNAPFLVFEDADVDAAVRGALLAKLRNMGEACTAANRFLVHESVAARFSHALADEMRALVVGRGTEPATQLGPLIEGRARDKVVRLVKDAVERGARVLTGGNIVEGPGWFYEPTVLVDVQPGTELLREEVFGPVAAISTFRTEDEAVALANDTELGLAAYVYTRDLDRGLRMSERIQSGMLGLNTGIVSNVAAPFGGIKQSGLGREGGVEGIEEYLSTQYVAILDPHAATKR